MKREHIQELIQVAEARICDAEREIKDLTRDEFGKYTEKLILELRKELKKWTEIAAELREEAEE